MSKRYSGKSFKDSSVMKKPKLTFKERRKLKEEKKKKKWKNFIGLCMKLKKLLTNKQYQKYLIKNVIQISACVLLLSIVFVAIWQEIF